MTIHYEKRRRKLCELPARELQALVFERFEQTAEKLHRELMFMGEPETLQDMVDEQEWIKSYPERLVGSMMAGAACAFVKEHSPEYYHEFLKTLREHAAQEEEATDYLKTIPPDNEP